MDYDYEKLLETIRTKIGLGKYEPTDWEVNFLDDVCGKYELFLSENQKEMVLEIWDKCRNK